MWKSGMAAAAAFAIAFLAHDCSVSATAAQRSDRQAQAHRLGATTFAQAPRSVRRSRTSITVRPPARVPATGVYPSPVPYAYPGPNAVRDCSSRLVTEYRPSGTVIVPRMRCWWTTQ
jgi:hypothetical protein